MTPAPPRETGAIDRGLARERTLLAWNRSALSLAAVAALVIRIGTETGAGLPADAVGGVLLALAGAGYAYGRLLYLGRLRGAPAPFRSRALALRSIAIATQLLAVLALVLAFPR